jgi:DNA polymerase-3 subunit chi
LTEVQPRIDFYILKHPTADARLRFACRLNEKAYVLNNRIYNHTASAAEARKLDGLMWTFRQGSFIPHEIRKSDGGNLAPVTIGHEPDQEPCQKPGKNLLINLTDSIPAFFDQFERVAEIIDHTDESRRTGRERYAFYKKSGYEPITHDIT